MQHLPFFFLLISPISRLLTLSGATREWVYYILDRHTWPLEMLQEFQREIQIHFIFWLPNLKRYWLSVLQLLCGKSRLFLMMTGICFQKALSCVMWGGCERGDVSDWHIVPAGSPLSCSWWRIFLLYLHVWRATECARRLVAFNHIKQETRDSEITRTPAVSSCCNSVGLSSQ